MQDQTRNSESSENQEKETNNESGDPGRTPGSAEGDRETVEEDLQRQDKMAEDKQFDSEDNS